MYSIFFGDFNIFATSTEKHDLKKNNYFEIPKYNDYVSLNLILHNIKRKNNYFSSNRVFRKKSPKKHKMVRFRPN